MAGIGKKILSAFIDIEEEEGKSESSARNFEGEVFTQAIADSAGNEKFKKHFEQLFHDANLEGPDYFEFAKMVEAMQAIPDEKMRYTSAFAGLSVQGLSKAKLVSSAQQYLKILEEDEAGFNASLNSALTEQVVDKKKMVEEKSERIMQLTREIEMLNNEILKLGNDIKEDEQKIKDNMGGYAHALKNFRAKINEDINKIDNLI